METVGDPPLLEITRIGYREPEVISFSGTTRNDEMLLDIRCPDNLASLVGCKKEHALYYFVLDYIIKNLSRSDSEKCLLSPHSKRLTDSLTYLR
jgi:hypothetical protein